MGKEIEEMEMSRRRYPQVQRDCYENRSENNSRASVCRILVPQPGIEPVSSAVKEQCPKHWTTREFPPLTESQYASAF
ncbi:hypothetical protein AB1E18_014770 [Capra hircus]